MDKDDVIKFIDGKVFYYSDYINFLYKQLELKDNIIKEIREYIEEAFKEDEINEGNIYHSVYDEIYQILDKVGETNVKD